MSDIFSEVDEEVRKDRSLELWAKYGKFVIGGAVVVVAATAGFVAWQNYQISKAQELGGAFEAANKLVLERNFEEGVSAFAKLSVEADGGYENLAKLRQANALVAAGNGADAVVLYDEVAASDAAAEFKNAARIFAGYYLIDNGTSEEVRDRVSALAGDTGVWSSNARELIALADIKDGKKEAALTELKALAEDAGTPEGVKSRSEQLVKILSNDS